MISNFWKMTEGWYIRKIAQIKLDWYKQSLGGVHEKKCPSKLAQIKRDWYKQPLGGVQGKNCLPSSGKRKKEIT